MDEQAAFIKLSLREGTFEIRGSEQFVASQADKFETLIHELLRTKPEALLPNSKGVEAEQETGGQAGGADAAYPRVFARKGEGFQITAKIPGRNKAEKTANIALLLSLARSLDGDTEVSAKEVREAAKAHACLDESNFKAALKGRTTDFLLEGSPKDYKVRLTHPGREKAVELAKDLQAE